MLRAWARYVVAFATALAAWVVATPAHAAAPLCDDRGATTFAPAPQLQSPETSIDVGTAEDTECFGTTSIDALQNGRGSQAPVPAAQVFDATLPDAIRIPPADLAPTPPPDAELTRAPPGVRGRVDRPPRS